MGVHCWIGETFGYVQIGYDEGCFPPGQWIFLFTLRRVRRISLSTEITDTSTGYTQGADELVGGTFVERCLDNLRC